MGDLVVTVVSARKLENKKLLGKQSPFVEVRLGEDTKKTSVASHGGVNAEWNEPLLFSTASPRVTHILFTVWGNRHLTGNDRLGDASFPLADVSGRGEIVTIPLMEDGEDHGQLTVCFAKGSVMAGAGSLDPPIAHKGHVASGTVVSVEAPDGTAMQPTKAGVPGSLPGGAHHNLASVPNMGPRSDSSLGEPSDVGATKSERRFELPVPVTGFGFADEARMSPKGLSGPRDMSPSADCVEKGGARSTGQGFVSQSHSRGNGGPWEMPGDCLKAGSTTAAVGTDTLAFSGAPHMCDSRGTAGDAQKGGVGAVVDPSTLTGYGPTGLETPVETDTHLMGFGAAGASKAVPTEQTISGYEAVGGHVPEKGPALVGYSATGGDIPVPGLQHFPVNPKDEVRLAGGANHIHGAAATTGSTILGQPPYASGHDTDRLGQALADAAPLGEPEYAIPAPGAFSGYEGKHLVADIEDDQLSNKHTHTEGVAPLGPFVPAFG